MIVFTYPGQGSQLSGMGEPWKTHPSWELVEEASDATGIDIEALLVDASKETLRETHNAQLSTFILSMVILDAVERLGLDSNGHAGHSLGEYSALTASGAIDFYDACQLVDIRGKAMKKAIEKNPGQMAAIIGLKDEEIEAVCKNVGGDVWIANYNSPNQVVIAGEEKALSHACDSAKEHGAKKISPLPVSGAFHTPLMSSAIEELSVAIEGIEIRQPTGIVIANVDATSHENPDTWKALMSAQLCSPVRWSQTLATLEKLNFSTYVELGPGKVLTGLIKRTQPAAQRLSVSKPSDLDQLLDLIVPNSASGESKEKSHEGEHLFATDRLVVSPNAGIFKPIETISIGEVLSNGELLGHVATTEVRSSFSGEFMGWIALEGERVTTSQPIAWLRVK